MREGERQARLVFGSCRVGAPERPPFTLAPADHPEGLGVDALARIPSSCRRESRPGRTGSCSWGIRCTPTRCLPRQRRSSARVGHTHDPPGEEIADFEEYTQLYRESWSDPDIRWLLSTVPSAMIFDDHDVNDDWNISQSWVEKMRALPWWEERVVGAFMSYWLYQHLGNLSPPELAEETLFRQVQADEDAGPRLREYAHMCDRESAASRWAYYRDFGRSRLLVIDSRAARVLADGRRDMIDADEWDWIAEHAHGSFDHLILATTLPVFLPHGIHFLEAWNEAVCDGRWGSLAARLGEQLRRAVDLEHWAAFQRSFEQLVDLLRDVSGGHGGEPPATITILSGDVHSTYVAKIDLGPGAGSSRVNQIVCSPFRNPLTPMKRRVVRAIGSRGAAAVFSALARTCRVPPPSVTWDLSSGPTYENSIGELELDERLATVTIYQARPADEQGHGSSRSTGSCSGSPRRSTGTSSKRRSSAPARRALRPVRQPSRLHRRRGCGRRTRFRRSRTRPSRAQGLRSRL